MTVVPTELQNNLKQHGQSLTRPRLRVFKALQKKDPQTMAELVQGCAGIDRASVYRTIALFEHLGIVQRVQLGWKYKLELSDAFQQHHHHLTCSSCGRSYTLPEDKAIETQLRLLAARHRFKMQSHQLEIQGLCGTCQSK